MPKMRILIISLFSSILPILFLLAGCEEVKIQTDWLYPRFDLENTGSNPNTKCQIIENPAEIWNFTFPKGDIPWSLSPVIGDIDSDGIAEFIIGGWNRNPEYWLTAFNIEDGSILWKKNFESLFYWSAPVITDVNRDGRPDLVLGTTDQVMALNGKDGSLIWEKPFSGMGMGMTVADVDNDKRVEVIINEFSDPKNIYLLNGQDGTMIWKAATRGSAYNIPTAGNILGDSELEVISHSHTYNPSRERLVVWDHEGNQLWSYSASPSDEQEANAPAELGWVPDFGYISPTLADFNADGKTDVGWGTRCHYYVLSGQGELIWRVPTVEGYGLFFIQKDDGTIEADDHGTGGPSGYFAAVGNLDNDPALEIVLSFEPEYRTDWDGESFVRTRITPANEIRVYDGKDGTVEWVFTGEYLTEDNSDKMHEPILVDLDLDGMLDVIALSSNGYLYALRGSTGEQLMAFLVRDEVTPTSIVHNLTFATLEGKGIVFYLTESYKTVDGINWTEELSLHALQIAADCQ